MHLERASFVWSNHLPLTLATPFDAFRLCVLKACFLIIYKRAPLGCFCSCFVSISVSLSCSCSRSISICHSLAPLLLLIVDQRQQRTTWKIRSSSRSDKDFSTLMRESERCCYIYYILFLLLLWNQLYVWLRLLCLCFILKENVYMSYIKFSMMIVFLFAWIALGRRKRVSFQVLFFR